MRTSTTDLHDNDSYFKEDYDFDGKQCPERHNHLYAGCLFYRPLTFDFFQCRRLKISLRNTIRASKGLNSVSQTVCKDYKQTIKNPART